jgi:DNA polymerase-3 subunit delta'
MMRESLINSAGAEDLHRVQGDDLKFIQDFSKVMNVKKIENSYKLINDATYHLERNGSAKMIFLDLSEKQAHVINP